jgi:hypothetical protein
LSHAEAEPSEKTEKIAFRGNEAYRDGLAIFARLIGESVQRFLETAVRERVQRIVGTSTENAPGQPPGEDGASNHLQKNRPGPVAEKSDVTVHLSGISPSASEARWITRLIRILRSKTPAVKAIKWNLKAFQLIPGVSGESRSVSDKSAAERTAATDAAIKAAKNRDPDLIKDTDEALEKISRNRERSDAGSRRTRRDRTA